MRTSLIFSNTSNEIFFGNCLYKGLLDITNRRWVFARVLWRLDRRIFKSLKEAQISVEEWVNYYNHVRHHSALDCKSRTPQIPHNTKLTHSLQWLTIKLFLVEALN